MAFPSAAHHRRQNQPLLLILPLLAITTAAAMSLTTTTSAEARQEGVCGGGRFYKAIFSFGDSLTDTGNLLMSLGKKSFHIERLPYGETFFHRPTGRCSNGRLIVDFLAEAMGMPLLPPYLAGTAGDRDFRQGVNFAVVGATALDADVLMEKGIPLSENMNNSLGVQIEWFRQMLPFLCSSFSDCGHDLLGRILFIVGEIGGNDYNDPLLDGTKTPDEIKAIVPDVVKAIGSAIDVLIEHGARTVVVPGNLPIGCISAYLAFFHNPNNDGYYDPSTGCIKWLNEFSEFHNSLLQDELRRLRERHPEADIFYADYYHAAMRFYRSPRQFGFTKGALVACCGGGGPYNYNSSVQCGEPGTSACDDPSRYANWDGLHLTESAYRVIADGLLRGTYAVPPIRSNLCKLTARLADVVTTA